LVTDFDVDNAPDIRKVPAVEASHRLTWEIVSEPAVQEAHDTAEAADDPDDGAPKVTCLRVVSAEALVVPERCRWCHVAR
jgi:hypothetical protein